MKRAVRKRAKKLRDKAAQSLAKLKGQDLQTVSNRASSEQYVATLSHFAEPQGEEAEELIRALAQEVIQGTVVLETELVPQFIQPEQMAEIDCRAGCAWCCHEPLQVSILDAISVASYLKANPSSDLELESYLAHLEQYDNKRAELKQSFDPCPFLDDYHKCRVYEARPVICRAFHSKDVGRCESIIDNRPGDREVPMFSGLFGFRGLKLSGARKALRDLGLDDRPVILAQAVKLLLDDFDAVAEGWLEGEDVFESAVVVD